MSAPVVVALLPLSADVDTDRLYSSLLTACETAGRGAGDAGDGMDLGRWQLAGAMAREVAAGRGRQQQAAAGACAWPQDAAVSAHDPALCLVQLHT